MTKLQTIIAEIKTLPLEEQRAVYSELEQFIIPADGDIFELTESQLEELDRRLAVVDHEPTFTVDEAFQRFVS